MAQSTGMQCYSKLERSNQRRSGSNTPKIQLVYSVEVNGFCVIWRPPDKSKILHEKIPNSILMFMTVLCRPGFISYSTFHNSGHNVIESIDPWYYSGLSITAFLSYLKHDTWNWNTAKLNCCEIVNFTLTTEFSIFVKSSFATELAIIFNSWMRLAAKLTCLTVTQLNLYQSMGFLCRHTVPDKNSIFQFRPLWKTRTACSMYMASFWTFDLNGSE